MLNSIEIFRMAHGLAQHAGARQAAVARNIAHANTPGYRQIDLPSFAETYAAPDGLTMRATRTGHLFGQQNYQPPAAQAVKAPGAPDGNNVSIEDEIVRAAELRQQHDMALAIYSSSLNILRSSLGRR